jgi:hypothetical protein
MRLTGCCRLIAAAIVIGACQAPTEAGFTAENDSIRRSHDSPFHVPGMVTFSDGWCTGPYWPAPLVECRWAFDEGPDWLNVWPMASLEVTYACVSQTNGRVTSTGFFHQVVQSEGVTGITTGTSNVEGFQLDPPTLPANSFTGKDKRRNACKPNNELVVTGFRIVWWAIAVDNWYPEQPFEDYRYECIGKQDPFDYCVDPTQL